MEHCRFVHLHNHTDYSLLDGACRVGDLVNTAKSFKMPAVAITDHGNMFGAIHFYDKAAKAGLKPLIGCEVYVARGSRTQKKKGAGSQTDHLLLLASSSEGYRNLLSLVSTGYLEGYYYTPRIDKEVLAEHSGGIVALSGCLSGEVARLAAAGDVQGAANAAGAFEDMFGAGNFYIEVQNHGLKEQLDLLPRLIEVGKKTGIPLVATNDCHYLRREDSEAHDVLLCVQTGKSVDDPERLRFNTDQVYFKSAEEMFETFRELPEVCENSVEVAEKCNVKLEFGKMHLPHFPLPEGRTSAEAYLRELAEKGLAERYGETGEDVRKRFEFELDTICQMGFAGYFLVVRDFIQKAREMRIPVGPGRGSAAGSLVSYCLRITDVDPLRFGLLFERFLNPERISMPDIDIDFGYERRDRVINYVVRKYGRESVTQIITFGTMAARAVVRDVGRALGVSYSEVDRLAKLIPMETGMTLKRALDMVPELRELSQSGSTYEKLIRCALTLEGLARHASTHAAGVLIAPGKLTEYVPLFKSGKDEVTTQYDMKSIERIGLLKMDFLGLRTLTVIDRSVETVNRREEQPLSLDRIPLDDERTFELLREARTVGVFQLESSGMRDLLRRLKPSCLEDIIAVNALHRPGPLQGEMVKDYILCKNGKKKIEYQHRFLEPILRDTHGVILYQEQVLETAHKLAGFSLAQADILRRAMGKKMPEEMDAQRRAFIDGAKKNGINQRTSERIFDLMANFAGYGFNKSHSTAYAMISYRTAYLKTHFPAEFMAASLTSEMGDTARIAILVEECGKMGMRILRPDICESAEEFTVTPSGIRYGLGAVRNVGSGAIRSIIQARENGGEFRSIFELCERIDLRLVNKRVLESLICAGACDGLPGHRAQLLSALSSAYEMGQKKQKERARGQASFFDSGQGQFAGEELPEVSPWPRSIFLAREKEMLGFYFSDHPLAPFKDRIRKIASCEIQRVRELSDGRNLTVVGVVSASKTIVGRNNKPMAFVTLEDFSGSLECVVFSDLYEKVRREIGTDSVVIVRGRTSSKEEEVKLVAQEVKEFKDAVEPVHVQETASASAEERPKKTPGTDLVHGSGVKQNEGVGCEPVQKPVLEIQLPSCRSELAGRLREVLAGFPGPSEVILVVPRGAIEPVRVRSRALKVTVDDLLLEAVREVVGPDCVRVGWSDGEVRDLLGALHSSSSSDRKGTR
ncbi:MAG: DNA polymerase III subunit alpha [Candidatus Eiseniibacteriota bacterium]|nr:MAG: DNA polymerase III subunit alpha [Candidatus Eisenbacteria bacterium]